MDESKNLEEWGNLIDQYYLSGASELDISVVEEFIRFTECIEELSLKQWRINNAQAANISLQAEIQSHIRKKNGVVRLFNQFSNSLTRYLRDCSGYSKDPWKNFVLILISDSSLFRWTEERIPQLFQFFLNLLKADPMAMFHRFLEMSRNESVNDSVSFLDYPINKSLALYLVFEEFFTDGDDQKLWEKLKKYHQSNTGGKSGLFLAFEGISKPSQCSSRFQLNGIPTSSLRKISPLYGIEQNYASLKENLSNFIEGKNAHHVLLWGYRGTGKSSCVQHLLQEFSSDGIRLIDYPTKDIRSVNSCFEFISSYKEKFIIFLDDLSFDRTDDSYKYLKTSLEGNIREKGGNFLIHATTNRRELVDIDESPLDERSDKAHLLDEKRAMDDRFGLKLFFDVQQFGSLTGLLFQIADEVIKEYDSSKLLRDFQNFCRDNRHTSPGGRSIRQFLNTINQDIPDSESV